MLESFGNQNTIAVVPEKEPTTQATADSWQDEAVANFEKSRNQVTEKSIGQPEVADGGLVEDRFAKELFGGTEQMEDIKPLYIFLTEVGFEENEFENLFQNVHKHRELIELVRDGAPLTGHLLFDLGIKVIDDPKDVEALVKNNNMRSREIAKNQQELSRRKADNPLATDEEYRLGIYKEAIESQVRDAVFELQHKGYSPVGSGFFDAITGSQAIFIEMLDAVHPKEIVDSINDNLGAENKRIFEQILVKESGDRIEIILVPKVRTMSLSVWKTAWDDIASCFPNIQNTLSSKGNVNNGGQGVEFRENQDKLRQL